MLFFCLPQPQVFVHAQALWSMPLPARQRLVEAYYALDEGVTRELVWRRLPFAASGSAKRSGGGGGGSGAGGGGGRDLEETAAVTGVSLRSCRRQHDNLRRVCAHVEEHRGYAVRMLYISPTVPSGLVLYSWNPTHHPTLLPPLPKKTTVPCAGRGGASFSPADQPSQPVHGLPLPLLLPLRDRTAIGTRRRSAATATAAIVVRDPAAPAAPSTAVTWGPHPAAEAPKPNARALIPVGGGGGDWMFARARTLAELCTQRYHESSHTHYSDLEVMSLALLVFTGQPTATATATATVTAAGMASSLNSLNLYDAAGSLSPKSTVGSGGFPTTGRGRGDSLTSSSIAGAGDGVVGGEERDVADVTRVLLEVRACV